MRFELELVRPSVAPAPDERTEPARKALRVATDRLIHDALLANDLPGLVEMSAETMVCVAETLAKYEQEPEVIDFVEAAQALVEQGRAVMDKGLLLRSWETTKCGAVMLEIACRDVCAALSVPYDVVLPEVHRARQAGENAQVRRVLTEAGLLKPESEDEASPS